MGYNLNEDNIENNIAKSVSKQSAANKRRKKKSKKGLILFLGTLLGIALCVLIAVMALDRNEKNGDTKTAENELKQEGQVTSTLDEMLEEEGMAIKTSVVNLYYPQKWKDQIRVEQIEGDVHTIQFFGTVKGKEEVQLFSIVFGKTEGALLGTINETEVYLVHIDISFDDNWNEEEQNEIYAMQEDVNYVIGMLQEEDGFVPSS